MNRSRGAPYLSLTRPHPVPPSRELLSWSLTRGTLSLGSGMVWRGSDATEARAAPRLSGVLLAALLHLSLALLGLFRR
jgi:hypothetical protein